MVSDANAPLLGQKDAPRTSKDRFPATELLDFMVRIFISSCLPPPATPSQFKGTKKRKKKKSIATAKKSTHIYLSEDLHDTGKLIYIYMYIYICLLICFVNCLDGRITKHTTITKYNTKKVKGGGNINIYIYIYVYIDR